MTEINVFLYDRLLGITTRVTVPPSISAVVGAEACCPDASSSYQLGSCSWVNRLKGQCCDQKPCRISLNAEISRDGKTIVFISDVNFEGSGPYLPKGDMEIWVHHVPTFTTHRVTHTHDKNIDETAPHISGDGGVVTFQSKHHYQPNVDDPSGDDGNFDVWASKLTYGCDDSHALNFAADYDIPECCTYEEVPLMRYNAARKRVSLLLEPVDFLGAHLNASTLESTATAPASGAWCSQWQVDVLVDLSCALRVPANRLEVVDPAVCTSTAGNLQVVVDIIPVSDTATIKTETPEQLVSRLQGQVKQPGSAIWKGYATRYLKNSQAMGLTVSSITVTGPPAPPSPPLPPPPAPPVSADAPKVVVAYVVAQTVDDFTTSVRTEIRNKFATSLGIDVTSVQLEVTAASAKLTFTIVADDAAAANDIVAAIPITASAASALLTTSSFSVVVTEDATVEVQQPAPSSPAIAAGESAQETESTDGESWAPNGWAIAGILVLCALLFGGIGYEVYSHLQMKKREATVKEIEITSEPIMMTSGTIEESKI